MINARECTGTPLKRCKDHKLLTKPSSNDAWARKNNLKQNEFRSFAPSSFEHPRCHRKSRRQARLTTTDRERGAGGKPSTRLPPGRLSEHQYIV